MLVRYLKHLIANGKTDGWGDLKHDDRKDDYVQFAIIKNNVLINGTEKEVGCFVGKKADGKTYYDLYIGQNKTVDGLPQFRARANNGLDIDSVNQENEVFNIFIKNNPLEETPTGNKSGGQKGNPEDIADNGEHRTRKV